MEKKNTRRQAAASRTVKRFWNDLMTNEDAEMKDRLKASEYLAKAFDLFKEKPEEIPSSDVAVTIRYEEDPKS